MFSGRRDEMMLDQRTNGDPSDTLGYTFKPSDYHLRASDKVIGEFAGWWLRHLENLKMLGYWVGGVLLGLFIWGVIRWEDSNGTRP